MKTSKLYAPAMPSAAHKLFRHSAIAGFWRRLVEFQQVYLLYRKAAHSRMYCAKIAWGVAFRGLPF